MSPEWQSATISKLEDSGRLSVIPAVALVISMSSCGAIENRTSTFPRRLSTLTLPPAFSSVMSSCVRTLRFPGASDAPGNLSVRTQDDITLENAGGKVKVDNRRGNVEVRFSIAPKEDIEITNATAGITLSLPESSSFEIIADCHSGDIDSEFQAD